MKAITEEKRQALTGLCQIEIKRWKAVSERDPNMRYMVELMEMALAALRFNSDDWKQRAEAAEAKWSEWKEQAINAHGELTLAMAKLAEMEKQEPVGYTYNRGIHCEIVVADLNDDCPCGVDLFSRPALAVSLAELVPEQSLNGNAPFLGDKEPYYNRGWNDCRAAMLRNIEEAK